MRDLFQKIFEYRVILYVGIFAGFLSGILITVPVDTKGSTIATVIIQPIRSFGDLILGVENTPQKPSVKLSAWIPEWDYDNGSNAFVDHADRFSQINPIWYNIGEDGSLKSTKYVGSRQLQKDARGESVLFVPTIQEFDAEYLHEAIGTRSKTRTHAQELLKIVNKHNLDGLDLDYESIFLKDQDNFFLLLEILSQDLHARGKVLVVDVIVKTSDDIDSYDSLVETRQVQDWTKLAQYVDEIRIMAYDYDNSNPEGSPINPYFWLEEVAEYAITKAHPQKFVLATPLYSYSWRDGELLGSHTYEVVKAGIDRRGAQPVFDLDAREWRVILFDEEEEEGSDENELAVLGEASDEKESTSGAQIVWYQDAQSFKHRLDLVKQYNFAGLALWRLGGEDTRIYELIE